MAAVLIGRVPELYRAGLTLALGVFILVVTRKHTLPADADRGQAKGGISLPTRHTIWLGVLCFLVLMVENATVDWAGIYLRTERGASTQLTSLSFACFAGFLALSRLLADGVRAQLGSPRVIMVCAIMTAVSLGLAVTVSSNLLALLFFALSGFFIGPIAPVFFAGGGRAEPDNPGPVFRLTQHLAI